MADIAELGFAITTKPLDDTERKLDNVTEAAGRTEKAVKDMATATSNSANKIAEDAAKAAKAIGDTATATARRRTQFDVVNEIDAALAKTAKLGTTSSAAAAVVRSSFDSLPPVMENAARAANRVSQALAGNGGAASGGGGGGGDAGEGAGGVGVAGAAQMSALAIRLMVGGIIAAIGAYVAFTAVAVKLAEAHEREIRHLTTLTGSRSQALEFYEGISKFAHDAGISLSTATEKAVAFAHAGSSLGATAQTMLGVAATVEKLSIIGGATPNESGAAQGALVKMFESAKVSATDLKTVLQNVPQVTDQIARGLGISVTQLRLMATEGKLTGDQVLEGLLKQQQQVSDQFNAMPRTVGQNLQSIGNDIAQITTRWSILNPLVSVYEHTIDSAAKAMHALNEATKEKSAGQRVADLAGPAADTGPSASTLAGRPERSASGAVGNALARQQYAEAIAQLEHEQAAAAAALTKALTEQATSALVAGTAIAQGLDPVGTKLKQLGDQEKQVNDALTALKSGMIDLPAAEVAARIDQMTDALRRIRVEADNTKTAAEKLWQELNRRDAQNALGMTEAQRKMEERVRQLTATGDITEPAATALVDRQQVQTVQEMVEAKEREADAQEALTKANGRGKEAMIQAAAAAALLEWQLKNVGASTEEAQVAMDVLVERYTNAVNRISAATSARGGMNAAKPLLDELASIAAAMKVVEQGAYAMRKAEAEAKAARSTDGTGGLQMQVFNAKQALTDATAIQNLREQVNLTNALAGAAGDVVKQKSIQLEYDIRKAQLEAGPAARGEIAEQMRAQATADNALALGNLLAETDRYIEQQKIEQQALGMSAEKAQALRLEYELLNKAKAQGITVDPAVIKERASAMAAAAQETRDMTDLYNAGKNSFLTFFSSFNQGIQQGKGLWESFAQAGLNALTSLSNALMEIAAKKLFESAFGMSPSSPGGGGGGWFGGIGSFFSGLFGGMSGGGAGPLASIGSGFTFAEGGNYPAGRPRIVGERGPELDVPRTAGTIFNQRQLASLLGGAGGQQTVAVHISLDTPLLHALVKQQATAVVAQATPKIVNRSVKQANKLAPTVVSQDHQMRGGDFRG